MLIILSIDGPKKKILYEYVAKSSVFVPSKLIKVFQFFHSDGSFIEIFTHFQSKALNVNGQTVDSTLETIVYYVCSATNTNDFSLQFSFKFPPYFIFAKSSTATKIGVHVICAQSTDFVGQVEFLNYFL